MRWRREWGIDGRRRRRDEVTPEADELSGWVQSATAQLRGEDDTPDYNPYLPDSVPSAQGEAPKDALPAHTTTPWQGDPDLPAARKPKRRKFGTTPSRRLGQTQTSRSTPTSTSAPATLSSVTDTPPRTIGATKAATNTGTSKRAGKRASKRAGRSATTGATTGTTQSGVIHPTVPGTRSGAHPMFWVMCIVIVVAGLLIYLNRGPSSDLPQAPSQAAEQIELDPIWSTRVTGIAWGAVSGPGNFGDFAAIGSDTLVVLTRPDYDSPADAAVGLDRGNGRRAWTFALEDIVCAQASIVTSDGEEILPCTGVRDGQQVLSSVRTSDGEVVREVDVDHAVAGLATAGESVLLLGTADRTTRAVPLSWYDAAGQKLWEQNLTGLSDDLGKDLLNSDDIAEVRYADWAIAGDAALLQVNFNAFHLDAEGATWLEDCTELMIAGEDYICGDWSGATRFAAPGNTVWHLDEWTLLWARNWELPALVVDDYDGGETVLAVADPATGQVGQELLRTDEYYSMNGTTEVPLLVGRDALVRLGAGGEPVMWERRYGGQEYGSLVWVAGDRVIIPREDFPYGVTVLDAETGEEIARTALATSVVVEDRFVLEDRGNVVSLYELP